MYHPANNVPPQTIFYSVSTWSNSPSVFKVCVWKGDSFSLLMIDLPMRIDLLIQAHTVI